MPKGQRDTPKHPIDRGAPASVIATKFGGMAAMAAALGLNPSTIHRWLVRGTIHGDYHDAILAASKAKGAKVRPADFVDTRPKSARGASAELAATA